MGAHSFNRPPRVRPRWAAEQVELPAPPAPPAPRQGVAWANLLMPLLGALLFGAVGALSGGARAWLLALPTGLLALIGVGVALHQARAESRREAAAHGGRVALFEDQLAQARARLGRLHELERTARLTLSPAPQELLEIAGAAGPTTLPAPRLWERRSVDDDFLELRAGLGSLPAASSTRLPSQAPDAPAERRLFQLAAEHGTLRQVPICLPLAQLAALGLAGPPPSALALLRALIWQAAVLHAPADLRIAAVYADNAEARWEWLRWLPHSLPLSNDPAPDRRMCAGAQAAPPLLSAMLDELGRRRERRARPADGPAAHEPHLLLLIDDLALARSHPAAAEIARAGAALRMSVIVRAPSWEQIPESCAAMLDVHGGGARWTRAGQPWPAEMFSPDQVDLTQSDRLARRLAGLRLAESGTSQDLPRSVRLLDLLKLNDIPEVVPPHWWDQPIAGAWRPDVPIGALGEDQPLCLDLNEQSHGPHGIIAGATGAGKSVLLQSIIAALAATHPPERLQLLLIDFKGGAALGMFEPLPHTAGMVTDLEGRMAERAIVAITSELRRRKRLLKQTAADLGVKIEHIGDYRGRQQSHGLDPLPNLLIIVDEFDELARSYPEFVGELVRVVKQGRSLGVHLLLATQQPARAVTDEIRSQLKFFIALRLGGAEDSREMILKPDAAFLPTDTPGRAYFRVGGESRIFQVAHVTGPYRPRSAGSGGPQVSFIGRGGQLRQSAPPPVRAEHPQQTDLDVLLEALRLAGVERLLRLAGWRPAAIWLAPLPVRLRLGALLPPAATTVYSQTPVSAHPQPTTDAHPTATHFAESLSLVSQLPTPIFRPPAAGSLCAPIGLVDIPQESAQEALTIDLGAGHLAVLGAPGSGKTVLLRTLAVSLAQRYSPAELWLYLIDAGGQGLSPLAGLPHVGAQLLARERERVRRLVAFLDGAIRTRQDLLRTAGAADRAAYQAATGERLPAIVVLIDKFAVLREELRDASGEAPIVDDLLRIARVGRTFGVHLVLSADRAADLTYRLLALFEARIALRMVEQHDYSESLSVRVSSTIPADRPGRGLWIHADHGVLDVQIALPSLAPVTAEDEPGALAADQSAELRAAVAELGATWSDCSVRPQPVMLLPELVPLASLERTGDHSGMAAPLGRESLGLSTVRLTLDAESPHALLIGPRRSGKTSALRSIVRGLAESRDPSALQVLILDSPRGGLRDLAGLAHTALYSNDSAAIAELTDMLIERRQGGGPPLVVIIDDYPLWRERARDQFSQGYGAEPNLFAMLCELAQLGGQQDAHLLVAGALSYADDHLLRALDAGRCGLLFWPGRYDSGTRLLGVGLPLPDQRDAEQPPGRALLVRDDSRQIVQVALSG